MLVLLFEVFRVFRGFVLKSGISVDLELSDKAFVELGYGVKGLVSFERKFNSWIIKLLFGSELSKPAE